MYKPSDAYYKEFTTANPSTGAAANADSLPAATANHNGSDDGSFTLTVANIDTGRYKITGTVPSGYAKGDVVNVTVAATCSSVAGKAAVDSFMIDSKRVGDLNDIAATAIVSAGAITTSSGAVSTVTTLTNPASINLSQAGLSPRALDSVGDSSLTVGDALVAAICAAAGKESVSGTTYTIETPYTGTTIRTFTLDSSSAPTTRS